MDPDLTAILSRLVFSGVLDPQQLGVELQKLGPQHQVTVYSELIHLLTHLQFEPDQAKEHWHNLLEHHQRMGEKLGSTLDLRVAIVSYFLEVARELENPTIIELRLLEQTEAMAYWDELTGLRNFRFFGECLTQEIHRSDKFRTPLSLVMIDLDEFKGYNDRFGHTAGNEALANIGRLISESVRKVDIAARYGGEEFAIIAPSTQKIGAQLVAERARAAIETYFAGTDDQAEPPGLTVSMGIATYPADAEDHTELINCADHALYVAKTAGRNRVELYGQSRRSYPRVEASLEGEFCALLTETRRMTTIDLGAGGVRFRTSENLELGTLIDATLSLPDRPDAVSFVGRVVQTAPEDSTDGAEVAISIVEMGSADRRALAEYLKTR